MIETIRQEAVEKFSSLPSPRSTYGLGMNTKTLDIPLEATGGFDYTINAPEGVNIYSGGDLAKAPKELLDKINTIAPLSNKADAFHYSQLNDMVIVHIPAGVTLEQPIMLNTMLSTACHVQHVLVVAEKNSKSVIVDTLESDQTDIYSSHIVESFVDEQSSVQYVSVQNLSPSTTHYSRKYGKVERQGQLHWIDCQLGAGFCRHRRHTALTGDHASSTMRSLSLGVKTQLLDAASTISHQAPQTKSRILTRTVLADESKSLHRANIIIPAGVAHCDGQQAEATLLLTDQVRAHAVPMLEIGNHEVSCSHGLSISSVNENDLFYLMSRGVSLPTAQQMIVEGFFSPVLDAMDCPTKHFVQSLLHSSMNDIKNNGAHKPQ